MTGALVKNFYINPNWPRFIWKHQANRIVSTPKAKKNGLKRRIFLEINYIYQLKTFTIQIIDGAMKNEPHSAVPSCHGMATG